MLGIVIAYFAGVISYHFLLLYLARDLPQAPPHELKNVLTLTPAQQEEDDTLVEDLKKWRR